VRVAVPRTPGNSTAFAITNAGGNGDKERTPEKAIANEIAKSAPKKANAKRAHAR